MKEEKDLKKDKVKVILNYAEAMSDIAKDMADKKTIDDILDCIARMHHKTEVMRNDVIQINRTLKQLNAELGSPNFKDDSNNSK